MKTIYIAILLFTISMLGIHAQDTDPYALLNNLKSRFDKIRDYSADMEIKVDVDFIKMPVKHATIYYKQPDKIKFKSDEFFMIPKRGLGNQLSQILNEPYNAIYAGEDTLDSQVNDVVKILPMGKKPDIILATWWIDRTSETISRTENNTRDQGTFTVDLKYGSNSDLLPAQMIISFEIENLSIPLKFIGKNNGINIDKDKMKDKEQGQVIINFSNYHINSSLPDEIFKDDQNEDE
jgi:outer membrane lipoprotein-sorting protein